MDAVNAWFESQPDWMAFVWVFGPAVLAMLLYGPVEKWKKKRRGPQERCPYVAPYGERCVFDAGHSGLCQIVVKHTEVATGYEVREPVRYYGINYR